MFQSLAGFLARCDFAFLVAIMILLAGFNPWRVFWFVAKDIDSGNIQNLYEFQSLAGFLVRCDSVW